VGLIILSALPLALAFILLSRMPWLTMIDLTNKVSMSALSLC
jgi:hypothetical protein